METTPKCIHQSHYAIAVSLTPTTSTGSLRINGHSRPTIRSTSRASLRLRWYTRLSRHCLAVIRIAIRYSKMEIGSARSAAQRIQTLMCASSDVLHLRARYHPRHGHSSIGKRIMTLRLKLQMRPRSKQKPRIRSFRRIRKHRSGPNKCEAESATFVAWVCYQEYLQVEQANR